jgi:hypothetical protein
MIFEIPNTLLEYSYDKNWNKKTADSKSWTEKPKTKTNKWKKSKDSKSRDTDDIDADKSDTSDEPLRRLSQLSHDEYFKLRNEIENVDNVKQLKRVFKKYRLNENTALYYMSSHTIFEAKLKASGFDKSFSYIVVRNLIQENDSKHNRLVENLLLETGLWSKLKAKLAKLGSLQRGIFNQDELQMARDEFRDLIMGQSKNAFKAFYDSFMNEDKYENYPNMESVDAFKNATAEFLGFYYSLKASIKNPETIEGEGSPLTVNAANVIVRNLRKMLQYFMDYELSDVYKHFENRKRSSNFLLEDDKLTGSSKSWSELESNKLPIILGAIGGASMLFGALVKTQWFMQLVKQLMGITNESEIKQTIVKIVEQRVDSYTTIADNRGMTYALGDMLYGDPNHFNPKMKFGEFIKQLKNSGLWGEFAGWTKNPAEASKLLETLASKPNNLGLPLERVLPLSKSTTTLSALQLDPSKMIIKITEVVPTVIKRTVIKLGAAGASSAAATNLSGMLSAAYIGLSFLGLGLIGSAAAVKLLRMKGLDTSRLKLMKIVLDQLVEFKDTKETQDAQSDAIKRHIVAPLVSSGDSEVSSSKIDSVADFIASSAELQKTEPSQRKVDLGQFDPDELTKDDAKSQTKKQKFTNVDDIDAPGDRVGRVSLTKLSDKELEDFLRATKLQIRTHKRAEKHGKNEKANQSIINNHKSELYSKIRQFGLAEGINFENTSHDNDFNKEIFYTDRWSTLLSGINEDI